MDGSTSSSRTAPQLRDPMPAGAEPLKSARYANRLYRNDGDNRFTDVTARAGIAGPRSGGYGMGVAAGDFDNDGFEDLYVTDYGANILYRNDGNGGFIDVTARAGVAAAGWSSSAGFFDYNNDGRLDLFVCRYVEWSFQHDIYCGERRPGYREYCHPSNFGAVTNLLYRNDGEGRFTDVSAQSGIARTPGKSLGVAFADYDDDGWSDMYVANDSVASFLHHNNRDGTFTETALTAGVAYNGDGRQSPAWAPISPTSTTTAGRTSSSQHYQMRRTRSTATPATARSAT